MASESNPRAAIHGLWEAFVPSFTFAVLFAGFLFFFLGGSYLKTSSADLFLALSQLEKSPLKNKLQELELLKLLPVAVFFSLAVALYLFDRIVLGLGHLLPPSPYWVGNPLLYLPEDRLLNLWGRSPRIQDFQELTGEVERLAERAVVEGQARLLEGLEWRDKQFSKAANWLAYSKVLVLWCLLCAFVVQLKFASGFIVILKLVIALIFCCLFSLLALACETHYFLEQQEARLRIAERMRSLEGAEFLLDGDRRQQFYISRATAWKFSRRPFVRLRWGSVEPFRRIIRAFWWRASKSETTSNKKRGKAPNTIGRADG